MCWHECEALELVRCKSVYPGHLHLPIKFAVEKTEKDVYIYINFISGPMTENLFYRGQKFIVEFAVTAGGTMPAKDFLDSLLIRDRAKITATIKRFADRGRIFNKEKFRKIEGEIFEFKAGQVRVFMYHCGRGCIALTSGLIKKQQKTPQNQIEKANIIRQEYNDVRNRWRGKSHGAENSI